MQRLGIDLGTTNTVAALDDRLLVLDVESALPSVVAYLPNGQTVTGSAARRRRAIDAGNTIFSSKRIIGRAWDEEETRFFCERYPFEFRDVDGRPVFVTRAGEFTPTEIAGTLLRSISQHLEPVMGNLEVRITVPAGFSKTQRTETLQAADLAGFRDALLIDEPASAARPYLARKQGAETVGVYDLGGGTFDFAVLDCTGAEPRVLATASDLFLGGDDVDLCIAEWASQEVLKQHNWDLTNNTEVFDRLLGACERAKMRLAQRNATIIELAQVDPDCPAAAEGLALPRTLLDELAGQLVRRTFITCDHVLREGGLAPADLDAVIFAGGSTHLSIVKEGVSAYFGRPALDDIEPMDVVALGAGCDLG